MNWHIIYYVVSILVIGSLFLFLQNPETVTLVVTLATTLVKDSLVSKAVKDNNNSDFRQAVRTVFRYR